MRPHRAPRAAALAAALLALCAGVATGNGISALIGGAAQHALSATGGALRTGADATRAGADAASDAAQQALSRAKERVSPRRSIAAAAAAPAPSPEVAEPPRCTASGPLAAQKRLNVSMDFGGRSRFFLLELPQGYDATPSPLMLVLHGAGSTAAGFLDGGACVARLHAAWPLRCRARARTAR
jgi:hypothetical protein